VGIDLLRISGNLAEADASKTIEKKHVDEALKSTGSINLTYTLKSLSDDEIALLDIIRLSKTDLTAGDLYEEFNKRKRSSYASFNRILNKIEFLRLIDTRFTGKGVKGNSRVVILRFEPEEIKKCMNPL
jgi:cell division control protein 6